MRSGAGAGKITHVPHRPQCFEPGSELSNRDARFVLASSVLVTSETVCIHLDCQTVRGRARQCSSTAEPKPTPGGVRIPGVGRVPSLSVPSGQRADRAGHPGF